LLHFAALCRPAPNFASKTLWEATKKRRRFSPLILPPLLVNTGGTFPQSPPSQDTLLIWLNWDKIWLFFNKGFDQWKRCQWNSEGPKLQPNRHVSVFGHLHLARI
jgi:hypothetical protein